MKYRLNKEQKKYATENHNLVFAFLSERDLEVDLFYDIVIMGYLRAVKNYTENSGLQTFKFSTIAYNCMRTDLKNHYEYLNRKCRNAPTFSLDKPLGEHKLTIKETQRSDYELSEKVLERIQLEILFASLNHLQQNILNLRLLGFSDRKIRQKLRLSYKRLKKETKLIQAKYGTDLSNQ